MVTPVAGLDHGDADPRVWQFVMLPNGAVCHVHVLQLDNGWGIALLDASHEHAEQQARRL